MGTLRVSSTSVVGSLIKAGARFNIFSYSFSCPNSSKFFTLVGTLVGVSQMTLKSLALKIQVDEGVVDNYVSCRLGSNPLEGGERTGRDLVVLSYTCVRLWILSTPPSVPQREGGSRLRCCSPCHPLYPCELRLSQILLTQDHVRIYLRLSCRSNTCKTVLGVV